MEIQSWMFNQTEPPCPRRVSQGMQFLGSGALTSKMAPGMEDRREGSHHNSYSLSHLFVGAHLAQPCSAGCRESPSLNLPRPRLSSRPRAALSIKGGFRGKEGSVMVVGTHKNSPRPAFQFGAKGMCARAHTHFIQRTLEGFLNSIP